MCLVTTPIDVQVTLVSDECMISPGCRGPLGEVYFQLNPLTLSVVELFDVIEIGASLPCIPTKKVDAVFVRDAMGA
jgi:hypothetical protein